MKRTQLDLLRKNAWLVCETEHPPKTNAVENGDDACMDLRTAQNSGNLMGKLESWILRYAVDAPRFVPTLANS